MEALHQQNSEGDSSSRGHAVAAPLTPGANEPGDLRRADDAAYRLRWLELRHGLRLDLGRSLVHQVPLVVLDGPVRHMWPTSMTYLSSSSPLVEPSRLRKDHHGTVFAAGNVRRHGRLSARRKEPGTHAAGPFARHLAHQWR
jgi:hypothetical protein